MQFGWLFTNGLFLIGVIYGLLNPFIGLMVFYAFSILRPTFLWYWVSYPTKRYSFYLGIITLVGWAVSGFGDWSKLRGTGLANFGLVLYILSGAFAAQFLSYYAPAAWDSLLLQFKIVLMTIITVSMVRKPEQIKLFAWITMASLAYLAWVFNSQYYFDGWNRILKRGFGGIDNNGAAMIMVMGVPLAFFLGIYVRQWWAKAGCLAAAFLMIHVVMFSFSRGAFLGVCMVGLATFIVAILLLPRKGLTLAIAVGFVFLSLFFAGNQVRQEFWSIFADPEVRDASAGSRFLTWGAAWRCMLDHPLGVGPRNFNIISGVYGLPGNKSVHNLFLQTGADYGFIGALGLTMFYGITCINTLKMTVTATAKQLIWPRYFGMMVSISLAGFMVCSTFIGMESVEVGFIISALGLCTVGYVNRVAEAGSDEQRNLIPELEEVPSPEEYAQLIPVGMHA